MINPLQSGMNISSMMPMTMGSSMMGGGNTSLMGLPGDMSSMTSEASGMMQQYGLTGGMDGNSNISLMLQQMLGGSGTSGTTGTIGSPLLNGSLEQQMTSYMNQIMAQYGTGTGTTGTTGLPGSSLGNLSSLSANTTEQQMSSYYNQILAQYGSGSNINYNLNSSSMNQFNQQINQIMAQYGVGGTC